MKYIKVFCCVIAISLMFAGCNMHIASSIDELLSPIAPFGENASVQKAMDDYVKDSYSLKTPNFGEYVTSYIFKDIDNDDVDEAVCFYEPSDDLGNVYMAVLVNKDSIWSVSSSVKGNGKDIYSVNFIDINDDSKLEIVACWDAIVNATTHNLSLYKLDNNDTNASITQLDFQIPVNTYYCVDFDSDGKQEIFTLLNNPINNSSSRGQLYSIVDSKPVLVGEVKLDGHITSYTKVSSDFVDGKVRIFADAISSAGDSMLTEVIVWSDHYESLVSPFYSYSTGLTRGTNRSAMINSDDIDNDGIIEIPIDFTPKDEIENVSVLDWKEYKSSVLVHKTYSLFVNDDSYLVIVPDDYINRIIVDYNLDTRSLIVSDKKTDAMIYSIVPVLKSQYSESDYADYTLIMEHNGFCYLAKVGESSPINIDQLKDLIRSY